MHGGKTAAVIHTISRGATVYCATKAERDRLAYAATFASRGDIRFVVGEGDPRWASAVDYFLANMPDPLSE